MIDQNIFLFACHLGIDNRKMKAETDLAFSYHKNLLPYMMLSNKDRQKRAKPFMAIYANTCNYMDLRRE